MQFLIYFLKNEKNYLAIKLIFCNLAIILTANLGEMKNIAVTNRLFNNILLFISNKSLKNKNIYNLIYNSIFNIRINELNKLFVVLIFSLLSINTVKSQSNLHSNLQSNSDPIQNQNTLQNASFNEDSIRLSNRLGINLFYGLYTNTADFVKIPNTLNCCSKFLGDNGSGMSINGYYEKPLSLNYGLGAKLGWSYSRNEFSETENQLILVNGEEQNGEFNYNLNSTLNFIDLQPYFYYNPIKNLNTYVSIGMSYNLSSTYAQWEQIGDNTNGVFKDSESKIRNPFNGEISNINSIISNLGFGISYEFQANKKNTLRIVPEFNFRYNLGNIIKDSIWNQYSLNFGIGVKYYNYKDYRMPPPPPAPPKDPPFVVDLPKLASPPKLSADLVAKDIDSLGNMNETTGIKVEDFINTSLKPLLNYVFFDYNSSELPQRYVTLNNEDVDKFNIDKLINLDIINTYYNVLNIVGYRLRQKENAKITLIGCNSNLNDEKNNLELSKKRAETIKDYFVHTWNIEENRINIESRNLPKQASKSEDINGQFENMRVEIISDDEEIYESLIAIDTVRSVYQKKIRFISNIKSDSNVKKIDLTLQQDNKEIVGYNINMNDTISYFSWDWEINEKFNILNTNPINYQIIIEDEFGQVFKTKKQILPIDQISVDIKRLEKIKDVVYENYSLILFDYGKTELASEHKKVVDFVKSRISPNAKVKIIGYTDSMGEDNINERISTQRAKVTHKRLDIPKAEFIGKGEKDLLFDNTLPEGRFYCRTVVINVENIVE